VVLIFIFCNFIQHRLSADVFQIPPQQKLIDKVAENIISALKNPEEAILFREL